MVVIVFYTSTANYRVLHGETYPGVLQTCLRQVIDTDRRILLVYDRTAKRTIFKSNDYNAHYDRLRTKYSDLIAFLRFNFRPCHAGPSGSSNEHPSHR